MTVRNLRLVLGLVLAVVAIVAPDPVVATVPAAAGARPEHTPPQTTAVASEAAQAEQSTLTETATPA